MREANEKPQASSKDVATNSKIGRRPTMRTLLLVVAVSLLAGTAFAQDTPKFEASLHSYMRFNPENSNVINSFSLNGGGGDGPRDSGSEGSTAR